MAIDVVLVERLRKRWRNDEPKKVQLSEEEVGKLIQAKWGKSAQEVYDQTPVGEWVMTHFYGTLTQIADCYKAAGETIYKEWIERETHRARKVERWEEV